MKTCVKVLIWVGMIIQFYMIYPIVFGILALKKLDSFKDRDELIKYSVLTMVFCSLAGGIVMLFMNEEGKPSTNNDNTNKYNYTAHYSAKFIGFKCKSTNIFKTHSYK